MISFGSIVHSNLEMLSTIDPAAPSDEAPAVINVGLARLDRLARARAAVRRHPEYSEHSYFLPVETAFKNWEAMQNVGR